MKTSRRLRYLILAIFVLLSLGGILLFPHININEDMTEYLPSDSRMKEGLDSLKHYFPGLDLNAYFVKVMTRENSGICDSTLSSYAGISGTTAVSRKDGFVLYQFSVSEGSNPKDIAAAIMSDFGDKVIVETNANSNMPDNMVMVLIIAVVLVFGILFLMCSSFVEALLFILTIGLAVIANMGTNALLPSVSMMTNTIVAVLQLVLSMDYSIILMNRFRQELRNDPDIDSAMTKALRLASASIFSSSFTTIVGLLALVFMKFRIGMDLGVVLAKGVLCSLVSIYTILPALILMFYKAIKATEKKVPLLHTDRIARFEMHFRIPLAVLFVTVFVLSAFLSRRTELSYASIWESKIAEIFPPQNLFSILYHTDEEDGMIALADSLSKDDKVDMVLSYPSIMKKKHTPEEMLHAIAELSSLAPDAMLPDSSLLSKESLEILYYAYFHPERDERMSFNDIMEISRKVTESGLIPAGINVEAISGRFEKMYDSEDSSEMAEDFSAVPDTVAMAPVTDVAVASADTAAAAEPFLPDSSAVSVPDSLPDGGLNESRYTRENCTLPMKSPELADFLGFSRRQAATIFSMAGKKNARMSVTEFLDYVSGHVLSNPLLKTFVSASQASDLLSLKAEVDAVLTEPLAVLEQVPVALADSLHSMEPLDSAAIGSIKPATSDPVVESATPSHSDTEIVAPPSPIEVLAGMSMSGRKYSNERISRALHNAGISEVTSEMVELMFLYYGSTVTDCSEMRMSLEELVDFLCNKVAVDEVYAAFLDDDIKASLADVEGMMAEGLGSLRTDSRSMAAVVTTYGLESEETFDFVSRAQDGINQEIGEGNYLIGESVMYKEMKDGFRKELLFLTLLTVVLIFLIVAVTFRSVLIPTILVLAVMTGVYMNVFVSGLGGRTMLYLAYLIVQSILMGATIDYGILFTNYYLEKRRGGIDVEEALRLAYRGSIHTIMTSGLIILCAPYIMSLLLPDPAITSILSSITWGALAAILLILFAVPATLAAFDRLIVRRQSSSPNQS